MRYWLFKSEPNAYSIDDLARDGSTSWTGVRNYQARNFMRDDMRVGDGVLFYHSSCAEPGIVGLAEVCSAAEPDPTQFDQASRYYDEKSLESAPRWFNVDIFFIKKTSLLPLSFLKEIPELSGMALLRKGNRLSIMPLAESEWQKILSII